jgi:hypothetical protein
MVLLKVARNSWSDGEARNWDVGEPGTHHGFAVMGAFPTLTRRAAGPRQAKSARLADLGADTTLHRPSRHLANSRFVNGGSPLIVGRRKGRWVLSLVIADSWDSARTGAHHVEANQGGLDGANHGG